MVDTPNTDTPNSDVSVNSDATASDADASDATTEVAEVHNEAVQSTPPADNAVATSPDNAGDEAAAIDAVATDAVATDTAATNTAATNGAASAAAPAEPASSEPVSSEPAPSRTRSRQPSMAQIMESDEFSNYMSGVDQLSRGAVLTGKVVHVDDNTNEALVDIGAKTEGTIARNEIGDEEVKVGDEIEVVVLRPEDDEGRPVLSKRRADYERTWRAIQEAKDNNTPMEGIVREQVKGGLIVDLGVPTFVPASHVDVRYRTNLSHLVGRTVPIRIVEIDRKKNKVIGSHRLAAEKERRERQESAWSTLQKDKIVEGVVRRITDFGAFVDIGGIDGLLHVREMSWGRVEHPQQVVKKGQKLQVLVLDIDEERKRVALGLKQLQSDPWKKVAKSYQTGQMVKGKIVHIAPSCAFFEIEEGVEGIIPISEISDERIKSPEEVLTVGQELEARIKQLQPNQRRITLSLKAAVQEREQRETRTAIREVNERAGGDDTVRLGDVFGQQLREARDRGKERKKFRDTARERAMQAAEEEEWDETDGPAPDIEADVSSDEPDVAGIESSASDPAGVDAQEVDTESGEESV